jgi:hypothetical protein
LGRWFSRRMPARPVATSNSGYSRSLRFQPDRRLSGSKAKRVARAFLAFAIAERFFSGYEAIKSLSCSAAKSEQLTSATFRDASS